jgi:multidrug efflux pump subunit AcrB
MHPPHHDHDPRPIEAFEALVRRWRPVVVEAAATILNNVPDAEAIGATGTPTVIVNGLMLGARRDSVFLRELIEAAIR